MIATETLTVRLLAETHGGEKLGPVLGSLLDGCPVDDVKWLHVHPEAAAAGKRFLGDKQLQDCYGPGDTPEHRAAARVRTWLGDQVEMPEVAIWDVHNSPIVGADFLRMGDRCSVAAFAGAVLLTDFSNVIIRPDSFSQATNGIVIEQSTEDEKAVIKQAHLLHRRLGNVAATPIIELKAILEARWTSLAFLKSYQIWTQELVRSSEGKSVLQQLEQIPPKPPFSPFGVAADILSFLGIPSATQLYIGSWGHNNLSPEIPALGYCGKQLRRMVFGSLYESVPHPCITGDWLQASPAVTEPES